MGYLNNQLEKVASYAMEKRALSEAALLALMSGGGGAAFGALNGLASGDTDNKALSAALSGTGGALGGLGGLWGAGKLGQEGSKLMKALAKNGKSSMLALPLLAALPALGIGAGSLAGLKAADKLKN